MELEEEERTQSGCCFLPALRSFFAGIRDMIRKRRVKQRRRNYRIAKMQEEERVGREHAGAKEKECSQAGLSNCNGERLEERASLNSGRLTNTKSPDEGLSGTVGLETKLQRQVRAPKVPRKRKGHSSRQEAKPSCKRWCHAPCTGQLKRAEPSHRRG